MSKKVLLKFQTITAGSMAGNLASSVTNIEFLDNIGVQLNFTTSDAVGTFQVQVSMDYSPVNPTAANWINLSLSPAPVAASANDSIYIDLNQLSAPWIRTTYTRTSGSGTLDAFICGKEV